ncbi:MAG: GNAT family N-acetyltransferase [Synergistaceae bacterium]|nr:GNAT family N-acetyltransferase [Synergistaceae bacterium]
MDESPYSIDLLTKVHDRRSFTSGNEVLDKYLKEIARQDTTRDVATVFVATKRSAPRTICGYYTLSTGSIPYLELTDDVRRIMPRYKLLPAIWLGRLAVAKDYQGRGLGETLLYDAFLRSLASPIAWAFLIVDAKEDAIGFYTRYGFEACPDTKTRLFMQKQDINKICEIIRD